MRTWRIWSSLLTAAAAMVLVGPTVAAAASPNDQDGGWVVAGHDLGNTRDATAERILGPRSVSGLSVAWSLTTGGDVRVTPVVADGTVYAPDDAGTLWAVDAHTGKVRWSHSIADYAGNAGAVVRTSPAVDGDELVFGDTDIGHGADIIAVNRQTGQLLWRTEVETHLASLITGAAVVYRGTVYVGVSSAEEVLATQPGYQCCTFRGSVVALNAATGHLLWQTHTVPVGYSGGSVWGSAPMIDPRNNLVYVGTGNNYSAPPGVCTDPGETGCTPPAVDDHADSIIALDRTTGQLRWFHGTTSGDVFTDACSTTPGCGPDFDFGSGPNLIQLPSGRQLVGVGQKNGVYWALDPNTGSVVWHTMVGPGSALGGIEFGSATDGRHVYAAESNFFGMPYQITSARGKTTTVTGGSWAALDAATGKILWQVADPQGAVDLGYVSTANGVVYAGSDADTNANMYALDARTGDIRWSFASGGPVVSGAAIVDGWVYWGSGYDVATACPNGTGALNYCASTNDKLYAFHLSPTR